MPGSIVSSAPTAPMSHGYQSGLTNQFFGLSGKNLIHPIVNQPHTLAVCKTPNAFGNILFVCHNDRSAPTDLTNSFFAAVLVVAITRAPASLASWMAPIPALLLEAVTRITFRSWDLSRSGQDGT